jgi:hypothetical protein
MPASLEELELLMSTCIQTRSAAGEQSVLAHGDSVLAHYEQLLEAAKSGEFPESWRAPKWGNPQIYRKLADLQPDIDVMRRYLRYHDCGKPLCLEVDADGRSHFPGHAEAAAQLWASLGGHADEVWLMRHDMLLHTASADECADYQRHRLMPGLLFAALSEIHSNAQMFGGIESVSFKAKAKQLDRRGAAMIRAL